MLKIEYLNQQTVVALTGHRVLLKSKLIESISCNWKSSSSPDEASLEIIPPEEASDYTPWIDLLHFSDEEFCYLLIYNVTDGHAAVYYYNPQYRINLFVIDQEQTAVSNNEIKSISILAGETAQLNCRSNETIPVDWYHTHPLTEVYGNRRQRICSNGRMLDGFEMPFSLLQPLPSYYVLSIRNATFMHSGAYECVEKGEFGNVITIGEVNVYSLQMSEDKTVCAGHAVHVWCFTNSTKAVKWVKDGHFLDMSSSQYVQARPDGVNHTLLITNAKVEDAGQYCCTSISSQCSTDKPHNTILTVHHCSDQNRQKLFVSNTVMYSVTVVSAIITILCIILLIIVFCKYRRLRQSDFLLSYNSYV